MSKSQIFSWESPDKSIIAEDICSAVSIQFEKTHNGKYKLDKISMAFFLALFYIKLRNDSNLRTSGTYKSFTDALLIGHSSRGIFPSAEREKCLKETVDHYKSFIEENYTLISDISEIINNIDKVISNAGILSSDWICENTGDIFEAWLKKVVNDGIWAYSETKIQPRSLTDLLIELSLDLRPDWLIKPLRKVNGPLRIYNPFAGLSSYSISLSQKVKNIDITSQELDEDTFRFSVMRLFVNDISLFHRAPIGSAGQRIDLFVPNAKRNFVLNKDFKVLGPLENVISVEDSIQEWAAGDFDFVICSLPLGFRHKVVHKSSEFLLKKCLSTLKDDGVFTLVLGSSAEYTNFDFEFRKLAIDSGFLQHVIRLPRRTLKYTSFSLTTFIFKKTESSKVRFTDLSDDIFTSRNDRGIIEFNFPLVKKSIELSEDQVSTEVEIDTIRKEGYSLSPNRYLFDDSLIEKTAGGILIPLKSILQEKRGSRPTKISNPDSKTVFITIKTLRGFKRFNLSANDINDVLSYDSNKIEDPKRKEKYWRKIESSSLIIGLSGNLVARAVDQEVLSAFTIYVDTSMRLFEFFSNEKLTIEKDFLLWRLNSTSFQNRKRKYEVGSIIPTISKKDFLEMHVEVPPMQFQLDQIRELNETSKSYQASIDAANRNLEILEQSTYSAYSDFAHLTHTLAPKLLSLSTITLKLKSFLNKDEEAFSSKRTELKGLSLSDKLEQIFNAIDGINHILDEASDSSKRLHKPKQKIELKEFALHIFQKVNFSSDVFPEIIKEVPIEFTGSDFQEDNMEQLQVDSNLELIDVLCEAIFKNAHDHAFINSDLPFSERKVVLTLEYTTKHIFITLKNNGVPFDEKIQKQHFITKGQTSLEGNTGIGGFDVDRIASYLGSPNWELINDARLEFPVQFKFMFPIIQM